ncbi:MAG: hypothetical protein Fur002_19350 [Anaerolineales bacterium]
MNVLDLSLGLQRELKRRKYFIRLEILEQTVSLIKARLYISADLFVQVYRNDRFQTTNFALIHNGSRLFARDELDGRWHRHIHTAPEKHDFSAEGQRRIELQEFLDEVEKILAELNLP